MTRLSGATSLRGLATEEPVGRSTAWRGMVMFISSEATLIAVTLGSYFYLRFQSGPPWPPDGIEEPKLSRPLIMTALILLSSVPLIWAERGSRRGRRGVAITGLATTILMTLAFLALQGVEYADQLELFTITTNAYGSLFYTVTGLHAVHVTIGLMMLLWLATAVRSGAILRWQRIRLVVLYWIFLDVVWVAVLFTVYLSPRL
jgi:heme/copper-type cytochrome/quinol oxidase subunit 3